MLSHLTHWGRVTHICVGKLPIIGSDNGLSPGRHQAIIWTNAGILIEPLGTNFRQISIGIEIFSVTKMRLKMSSAKRRSFYVGLNVLNFTPADPKGPHDKKSTMNSSVNGLVQSRRQVIPCIMTLFIGACSRHQAWMSYTGVSLVDVVE